MAAHGINGKVLTSDNEAVTGHVWNQVGLTTDQVLQAAAIEHNDFAKFTPLPEERIVRSLRASGPASA